MRGEPPRPVPPRDLGDGYPKACSCGRLVFSPEMARKHRCSGAAWAGSWGSHGALRDLSREEAARALAERSAPPSWCGACGVLIASSSHNAYRLATEEVLHLCPSCLWRARLIEPRPATVKELCTAVTAADDHGGQEKRGRRKP